MIVELNDDNCFQVNQFDDTHKWFLGFTTGQQIDRLIYDLKEARIKMNEI